MGPHYQLSQLGMNKLCADCMGFGVENVTKMLQGDTKSVCSVTNTISLPKVC